MLLLTLALFLRAEGHRVNRVHTSPASLALAKMDQCPPTRALRCIWLPCCLIPLRGRRQMNGRPLSFRRLPRRQATANNAAGEPASQRRAKVALWGSALQATDVAVTSAFAACVAGSVLVSPRTTPEGLSRSAGAAASLVAFRRRVFYTAMCSHSTCRYAALRGDSSPQGRAEGSERWVPCLPPLHTSTGPTAICRQ